jgi:hypothetical protein
MRFSGFDEGEEIGAGDGAVRYAHTVGRVRIWLLPLERLYELS